jgi:hypothetical protein
MFDRGDFGPEFEIDQLAENIAIQSQYLAFQSGFIVRHYQPIYTELTVRFELSVHSNAMKEGNK